MTGFEVYLWHNEPIEDIHQWCKDRNEKMVKYKCTKYGVNTFTCKTVQEVSYGQMPETFWNCLRMSDGCVYEEVK